MTMKLSEDIAAILTAEASALRHYIEGMETGIPQSDIILAMKIHLAMLEAKAKELGAK
jgi:hypothetical protein